ncbi:hypothetical protein [Albidovulum sp.]|uniref:hypothetical protein n=1 Tax=Albidovulum sp. TaxID=1872424 RepID=UPI0039B92B46
MTRRKLLLTTAGLVAALAVPAAARDVESDVETRLAREGFRITGRSRTWLGRVRIEATRGRLQREIVLDPSTGEILRDYTDDSGDVRVADGNTGSGANGSTAGSGSSATDGGGTGSDPDAGSEPDGDGNGSGEEPGEEPSKEPAREPGEEPSRESGEEPSKEPGKEPSKESSKGWSKEKKSKESTGVGE